jgi:hypothetical protein
MSCLACRSQRAPSVKLLGIEYHPSHFESLFQSWQRLTAGLEFLGSIDLGIHGDDAVEMPGEKIGPATEAEVSFMDDNQVDSAIGGIVPGYHVARQDNLLNSQIRKHIFDTLEFLFQHLLPEFGEPHPN